MIYTIEELADRMNEFGHVTDPKEQAGNLSFTKFLHGSLKEGGVWGWPAATEVYKKKGDGFERLL